MTSTPPKLPATAVPVTVLAAVVEGGGRLVAVVDVAAPLDTGVDAVA